MRSEAVDGTRLDFEIAAFSGSGGHGVHAMEVIGSAVIAAGLAALWKASRP